MAIAMAKSAAKCQRNAAAVRFSMQARTTPQQQHLANTGANGSMVINRGKLMASPRG